MNTVKHFSNEKDVPVLSMLLFQRISIKYFWEGELFLQYQCLNYDSLDNKFLKHLSFILDDEELYSLNIIGVNDSFAGFSTKKELVYRNELMKIVYELTESPYIRDLYENENLDIFGIIYNPKTGEFQRL